MSEDLMLKCLIAFVLGYILCKYMGGNGFSVGVEEVEYCNDNKLFTCLAENEKSCSNGYVLDFLTDHPINCIYKKNGGCDKARTSSGKSMECTMRPPPPAPPPPPSCKDVLTHICEPSRKISESNCLMCAGTHASEIVHAGCTNEDITSWCNKS